MKECLNKAGCFICSATETLAPADAILYKLRNITSTVDNRGLIASSILSKKAAEGIGLLVLDVKFGRGSFSETEEDARKLAEIMVSFTTNFFRIMFHVPNQVQEMYSYLPSSKFA